MPKAHACAAPNTAESAGRDKRMSLVFGNPCVQTGLPSRRPRALSLTTRAMAATVLPKPAALFGPHRCILFRQARQGCVKLSNLLTRGHEQRPYRIRCTEPSVPASHVRPHMSGLPSSALHVPWPSAPKTSAHKKRLAPTRPTSRKASLSPRESAIEASFKKDSPACNFPGDRTVSWARKTTTAQRSQNPPKTINITKERIMFI